MFKNLQKFLKLHYILAFFGLVLIFVYLNQYSKRKGSVVDGLTEKGEMMAKDQQKYVQDISGPSTNSVMPAQPAGQNETFAAVNGMSSQKGYGLPPSCSRQPIVNPEDLLPKDENSQWAQLNPRGTGELDNINLLQAGYLNGIDTVGSSLRNANLQLRSEPPNPQAQVSPWLNTTIEPDLLRLPLEIGCGKQ